MDVAAACSGFVYAYATAHAYITSGLAKHVLVIGAELLTRFLDYTDRNTCILFGDGAGAVVLSASDEPGGGLGIEMTTEPQGAYMIWLPAGGAKSPPSAETIARGEHYIRMEGKETYRFATRTLASTALEAIRQGRPGARRHRPVHPAPGQHPDHRGGRQGPRPADGEDVREPRQVREHVGRVGADRPGRGRQRGPRQGRRQDRDRRLRGGLHERRRGHRVDRRPGARDRRRRRGATRPTSCPGAGRLGLGRPDPRRARRADGPARDRSTSRSTTSSPASPSPPARRSTHDRPDRQERPRDRRLARHRPRDRDPARDPGRRRRASPTRATPPRPPRPSRPSRGSAAARSRSRPTPAPRRPPTAWSRRRSRPSARSTSSSTTPASPATT